MFGTSMTALLRRAVLAAVGAVFATVVSAAVAGLLRMLFVGLAVGAVVVLVFTLRHLAGRAHRGDRL